MRKQINLQHAFNYSKSLEWEREKFAFHGNWTKQRSELHEVELQKVVLEVRFLQLEEEFAMLTVEYASFLSLI
jgi:hypothetical protein